MLTGERWIPESQPYFGQTTPPEDVSVMFVTPFGRDGWRGGRGEEEGTRERERWTSGREVCHCECTCVHTTGGPWRLYDEGDGPCENVCHGG